MTKASMLTATALAAMLTGAPMIASAAIVGGASSNTAQANGTPTDSGANEGQQPATTSPSVTGTNQPSSNVTTDSNQGMTSQSGTDQQLSQDTIQNVQQKLQQDGYYKGGHVDGMMGPHTRQAVQRFQQAKGLPSSGQLDQQTLAALGVNAQDNGQSNGSAKGG
jgi:peptidoglycan hydrolase-like protein with peptidoglycan-binding domain